MRNAGRRTKDASHDVDDEEASGRKSNTRKKKKNIERTAMCRSTPSPNSLLVDSGTTSHRTELGSRVSGQRLCNTELTLRTIQMYLIARFVCARLHGRGSREGRL